MHSRAAAAMLAAAAVAGAQHAGSHPVQRLLAGVSVGAPIRHENLTLYPLTGPNAGLRRFVLLDEAIGSGAVQVHEKGGGEVNTVRMRNSSKTSVFGMAGEIVSGARQDRMLKDDVLLPPNSGWVDVEVYCTEHGRWTAGRTEFGTRGDVAAARVRKRASQTTSQAEVWAEVDAARGALDVTSPTQAFARVYDDETVQRQLEEYRAGIGDLPAALPRCQGVVVVAGGRIVCVDLFGSNEMLARMWPKLIRSYVIDALSEGAGCPVSAWQVRRFLAEARRVSAEYEPSAGSGRLYRLSCSTASGTAMLFDRQVVHMDLFPTDGSDAPCRDGAPSLDIRRRNSRD